MAGIAGMSAGLDWIKNQGIDNIYKHEIGLLGTAMAAMISRSSQHQDFTGTPDAHLP